MNTKDAQRDQLAAALRRPTRPAPKVKKTTTRLTLDLDDDLHRRLSTWAAQNGIKMAKVARPLFERLMADDELAAEILREARAS